MFILSVQLENCETEESKRHLFLIILSGESLQVMSCAIAGEILLIHAEN